MNLTDPVNGAHLAVLDCESTNLPGAPDCHIVEIAVVFLTFGAPDIRVAFASKVRPPIPIPDSASRIHGITDADVADAPTWGDIAQRVADACEGRLLVAYNAPADHQFIADDNARVGVAPPPWPWLDMLVMRKALKTRGAPGKLTEVAAEYGIILDAHGATGDAFATAMMVRPMLRAVWERGLARPRTIGELLDWQRGVALEREREYADYCRRKGDAKPPQCGWHEREGVDAPTWDPPVRTAFCTQCGAAVAHRIGQTGRLVTVNVAGGEAHGCPSDPRS